MRNTQLGIHTLRASLGAALCILFAACSGGGGSDTDTGTVRLSITDGPLDETRRRLQFSGVAFKREGSASEFVASLSPTPQQIDLLQYQQGRAAVLLSGVVLTAGRYEWLRLIIDNEPNVRDSYLVLESGAECELRVPSGAESGLKLNGGFTLPADGTVALTVDFDLFKSIHAPPGQRGSGLDCTQGFLMRPTLRLVDDANVGAIAGSVDAALVDAACLPKAYVFEGSGVVPDDVEETSATTPDVDPLVVATVEIMNGATQYDYRAAFIPAAAIPSPCLRGR
jgi:hypothetical protein